MIEAKDFWEPFRKVMFRYLPDGEEAAPVVAAVMSAMYLLEVCDAYSDLTEDETDSDMSEMVELFEREFRHRLVRLLNGAKSLAEETE